VEGKGETLLKAKGIGESGIGVLEIVGGGKENNHIDD